MKKHKKISRTAALLAVSTATKQQVTSAPRETLKSFQHRYDADQREAQEAPIRAAKTEHSRLLQQLMDQDREAGLYNSESTYLSAVAPSIGDGSRFDGVSPDSIKATIRKCFSTFEDQIASEGTLSMSGKQKLQNFSRANLGIAWDSPEAWFAAFTLLRTVGEITDQGDSDQPDFVVREIPEATRRESFDEVLAKNDTFSREGRKQVASSAMRSMQGEALVMFQNWERLLYSTWGVTLTESQKKAVCDWFVKWNKSYLRHESFNEARRALVKAGVLPSNMILEDEALAERIQHSNLNDYEARRDFAAESRRINGR